MAAFDYLQLRRSPAAVWTSTNPVLRDGEPGYESDTGALKLGDGVTAWTSLPYFGPHPDTGTLITAYTRLDNPNFVGGIYRYNGGAGLVETNGYFVADEYYLPKWDYDDDFNQALDDNGFLNTAAVPELAGYWGDTIPGGVSFTFDPGIYRWTFLAQLKATTVVEATDSMWAYMDMGTAVDGSFANNDTQPTYLAAGVNTRLLQLGGTMYIATPGQYVVPAITLTPSTTLEEGQYLSVVFWKLQ